MAIEIGLSQVVLENDIKAELKPGLGTMELHEAIARAVAAAITKNNREIESQLQRAGLTS